MLMFIDLIRKLKVIIRRRKHLVIVFLPFHHIGGAEKVHTRITSIDYHRQVLVLFTHKSKGNGYINQFNKTAITLNISKFIGNKASRILFYKILSCFINYYDESIIIGCNTKHFYELLPMFSSNVKCIDIIHALGSNIENSSLPYVSRIDRRIVFAEQVRDGLVALYLQHGLAPAFSQRIMIINNYAEFPVQQPARDWHGRLNVLYAGRAGGEKRVFLLSRLARLCHESSLNVKFTFVGDVAHEVPDEDRPYCNLIGEISRFEELAEIYSAAHIFVMASSREGVPLALLDAMAFGLVPIVTAVGGIPEHIVPGRTGFLVDAALSDDDLVTRMLSCLSMLDNERNLLSSISQKASSYAYEKFQRDGFEQLWEDTILGIEALASS
jgi:glycosyltransferase involved in cell wall biosynthesis